MPRALALARSEGLALEMMSTSYFLNRRSFRPSPDGGMPLWQDKLFIAHDQGRLRRHRLLPPALEPRARARPAVHRLGVYLKQCGPEEGPRLA